MSLYQLAQEQPSNVTREQLRELYSRVLVNGGERAIYNSIRNGSHYQRCPLCVQRDVQTLDHYLSQTSFPEFAILPINLVPSCFECNHAKLNHLAASSEEQLFHPYYDDWGIFPLFSAVVQIGDNVEIEFHINDGALDETTLSRLNLHFEMMGLATLYAEHAAIELVQKRLSFVMTFNAGGPDALRDDLLHEAASRTAPFPNSWQPVLYRALAASAPFYEGGFLQIVDQVEA